VYTSSFKSPNVQLQWIFGYKYEEKSCAPFVENLLSLLLYSLQAIIRLLGELILNRTRSKYIEPHRFAPRLGSEFNRKRSTTRRELLEVSKLIERVPEINCSEFPSEPQWVLKMNDEFPGEFPTNFRQSWNELSSSSGVNWTESLKELNWQRSSPLYRSSQCNTVASRVRNRQRV